MLQCEGFSSKLRYDFEIPNGENVQNWISNVVLKFHDDPTVNESEIVIFLRQVWWAAGKRKSFEGRREKTKMRGRRGIVSLKSDLTSLFILRVHTNYYFIYFYHFIKTNFILFVIKCICKIPFYFLSNYYFN